MKNEEFDAVERPQHYAGQGEIECIDFIEICIKKYNGIVAGCLFNILKYAWRVHNKNGLQDLKKALWYAKKAVNRLEYYSSSFACSDCAASSIQNLNIEEEFILLKAVNQITSGLTDEETKCFLTIVSCIVNGGLLNFTTKDYSNNLIEAIETWIKIYDEN